MGDFWRMVWDQRANVVVMVNDEEKDKPVRTDSMFRTVKTTYMLFTSREVRIGKNCARGLGYRPRPQAEGCTQDRGHSFSQYGPT